jgi:hypothetical protein
MSIVLLVIVLVGFSRTLYLRAFFDVPPIPPHVYVHGVILTAWFTLFCLQTSLVAGGRSDLHRRLGILGAGLGVAVVLVNAAILWGIGPRLRVEFQSGHVDPAFLIRAVWGDFGSLIAFAVLLSAALMFRGRPEAHKRLMFLASASIVGPALGRIMHWPIFAGIHVINLPTVGMIVFLGGLLIYDVMTTKRAHPATILGGTFRLLVWVGVQAIAASEFGRAFVRGMT